MRVRHACTVAVPSLTASRAGVRSICGSRGQKTFDDTALARDIRKPGEKKPEPKKASGPTKTLTKTQSSDDGEEDEAEATEDKAAAALAGVAGVRQKVAREQRGFVKKSKKGVTGDADGGDSPGGKGKKMQRSWDPLGAGPVDKKSLDRCTDRPEDAVYNETAEEAAQYIGSGKSNVDDWEVDSDEEGAGKRSGSKGIWDKLKLLAGGSREMTEEDLAPVMEQFRDLLISKNVARDCAEKLCASVGGSLRGKTISGYNGVKNAVKASMEEALLRILTPKQDMDIIRQVKLSQAQKKPYVVVFVGVNGVGKSTSLSKVCFWLKAQKFRVMLAACDTFRSGAVEQLKTHASRLDVPVFEKGYNKDAAAIALDAVKHAEQNGFDVVLVDTAGRMQDNEPLMRSLSKLVNLNNPDLVLFVGEALVGNDSIDQVTKFNKALKETAYGHAEPRLIDGIMLTKFDTIDDKVGAAVSMVYVTGQPVVLVGVGQTYTDLKKLNASNIVKLLLR